MALPQVGVEAVVKGLAAFQSDIGKLNNSLGSIGSRGNIVSRTLSSLGNVFTGLGRSMLRVAEVALGVLVRDAFRAIIRGLTEIIKSTIQAGAEFQLMELRLKRLNLNTLMESGLDYQEAMEGAIQVTKEQLRWIQKLAVTTPFDATDISNTFTLARSYGFAGEQAQKLTKDIADFSAGMGLGSTEIKRIIINFGQMVQQGKVTQREMNDLARGAFVPVNDVLKKMQENVDMTDAEFKEFRYTGEGVQAFMEAFSQIVETRFAGASEDMARTFKGATDNAKDFLQSLIGFGIVRPILGTIGGALADFITELTNEENWDRLTSSVDFFSNNLTASLRDVLGLAPDAEGLVDGLVKKFQEWGIWIGTHREEIVGFFQDAKDKILEIWNAIKNRDFEGLLVALGVDQNVLDRINDIRETVVGVIDTIKAWVDENGPLIEEFFSTLGEIVGGVFENLTGDIDVDVGGGLDGLLAGVQAFMQYVIDNKDNITEFVTMLVKLWGVLQVIGFVLSIILPPILSLIAAFVTLKVIVAVLAAIFGGMAAAVLPILAPLLAIGIVIGLWVTAIKEFMALWPMLSVVIAHWWEETVEIFNMAGFIIQHWATVQVPAWFAELSQNIANFFTELVETGVTGITNFVNSIVTELENLEASIKEKVDEFIAVFEDPEWGQIGRAIIEGVAAGVMKATYALIEAAVNAAKSAIDAVKAYLGVESPSKVFMEIGENTMKGMAIGIAQMSKVASAEMERAAAAITMPAIMASAQVSGAVSTQNNYTTNLNLTVNSSAPSEPIVQDYNMMKSMAGL